MAEVDTPGAMSPASVDVDPLDHDKKVERLLSEKLLEGYALVDTACPQCVTPLVKKRAPTMTYSPKRQQPVCKGTSPHPSLSYVSVQPQPTTPVVAASEDSFDAPFSPVSGVPYCVLCEAHVVTRDADIIALERCNSLKDQGRIIVAIEEEEEEPRTSLTFPSHSETRTEQQAESESPEDTTREDEAELREEPERENPAFEEEPEQPPMVVTSKGVAPLVEEADEEVDNVLAKKRDPPSLAAAAFICNTTASQMVVPSPVEDASHEEEGVEHALGEHEGNMESSATSSDVVPLAENGEVDGERGVSNALSAEPSEVISADDRGDEEEEKKADVEEDVDYTEDVLQEYSVRRDIATKVLGAKMLQGYALQETQCLKCGMPLMEYQGKLECVVCPVLMKKARKKLKVQEEEKRLAEQRAKIQAEIAAAKKADEARAKAEAEAAARAQAEAQAAARAQAEAEARAKAEEQAAAKAKSEQEELAKAKAEAEAAAKAKAKQEAAANAQAAEILRDQERSIPQDAPEQKPLGDQDLLFTLTEEAAFCAEEEARLAEEERLLEEARLAQETRLIEEPDIEAEVSEESFICVSPKEPEGSVKGEIVEDQDDDNVGEAYKPDAYEAVGEPQLGDEEILYKSSNGIPVSLRAQEQYRVDEEEPVSLGYRYDSLDDEESQVKLTLIAEDEVVYERNARATNENDELLAQAEEEERLALIALKYAEEEEKRAQEALRVAEAEEELALMALRAEEKKRAAMEALKAAEEEERRAQAALQANEHLVVRAIRTEEERRHVEELLFEDERRQLQEAKAEQLKKLQEAQEDEQRKLREAHEEEQRKLLGAQEAAERKLREEAERKLRETEAMRAEQARIAEFARLEEDRKRQAEIEMAEKARIEAEEEMKREEANKAAEEEARLIDALEREANKKSKAAEEAMMKAKAALDQVSSVRRQFLQKTIAQAEVDAVAEAEAIVMSEAELFKEPPPLPPTESMIIRERWETLRAEGRTVMTRRMLQGWTMLPELCKGAECGNTPLISSRDGKIECVVCGGTGNGLDGVYEHRDDTSVDDGDDGNADEEVWEEHTEQNKSHEADRSVDGSAHEGASSESEMIGDDVNGSESDELGDKQESTVADASPRDAKLPEVVTISSNGEESVESMVEVDEECSVTQADTETTMSLSVSELKDDFEAKRKFVSKQIGRKMLKGWTLLDKSCPECMMPLMNDPEQGEEAEVCVLCGPIVRRPVQEPETPTRTDPPEDPPTSDEESIEPSADDEPVATASDVSEKSEHKLSIEEKSVNNAEIHEVAPVCKAEEIDEKPATPGTVTLQLPAGFDVETLKRLLEQAQLGQPVNASSVRDPAASEETAGATAPTSISDLAKSLSNLSARASDPSGDKELTTIMNSLSNLSVEKSGSRDNRETTAISNLVKSLSNLSVEKEAPSANKGSKLKIDTSAVPLTRSPNVSPRKDKTVVSPVVVTTVTTVESDKSIRAKNLGLPPRRYSPRSPRIVQEIEGAVELMKAASVCVPSFDEASAKSETKTDAAAEHESSPPPASPAAHGGKDQKSVQSPKRQTAQSPRELLLAEATVSPKNTAAERETSPPLTSPAAHEGKDQKSVQSPKRQTTQSPRKQPFKEVKKATVSPKNTNDEPARETSALSPRSFAPRRLPPRPSFKPFSPETPLSPESSLPKAMTPRTKNARKGPPRPEAQQQPSPSRARRLLSPSAQTSPSSTASPRASAPFAETSPRKESRNSSDTRPEVVANSALDVIMKRMEDCQQKLIESDDPVFQAKQAALIEKLAATAVALRQLEEV